MILVQHIVGYFVYVLMGSFYSIPCNHDVLVVFDTNKLPRFNILYIPSLVLGLRHQYHTPMAFVVLDFNNASIRNDVRTFYE